MKSKKWMLPLALIMAALALCAFTIIPTIRLAGGNEDPINISYGDVQVSDGQLTLVASYNSNGTFFEVGRHPVVATDPDFTNLLQIKSCTIAGGNYIYGFDTEDLSSLERVYVKPPTFYTPTEITPVTVPLTAGQAVRMSAADADAETGGTNWFSVDTIDIEEDSEGTYMVRIMIDAVGMDLPRLPKLVNGETEIGGISALYFDEDDNFKSGEFLFRVGADSQEEAASMVASASLVVRNALMRVDAGGLSASSGVRSLAVAASEED